MFAADEEREYRIFGGCPPAPFDSVETLLCKTVGRPAKQTKSFVELPVLLRRNFIICYWRITYYVWYCRIYRQQEFN